MKYLLSPLQLGQLINESNFWNRYELVKEWMKTYYIRETSDDASLYDHIRINELISQNSNKKRK